MAMRSPYIYFVLISFWITPGQVLADCWKIVDKDNAVIQAQNIWNVHDRLSEKSALLGELKGEELVIPVDAVQSFIVTSSDKGWFGLAGSEGSSVKIKFQDGRQAFYRSDMNLFYLVDAEQKEMPVSSVRSVERCVEKTAHKMRSNKIEAKALGACRT